jgi:ribose transport system permease protein
VTRGWQMMRRIRIDDAIVGALPYAMLIALVVILASIEPASFTVPATNRIIDISVVLILVGIGQTFALLSGGIDLSVGGVVGLVSAIAATKMSSPGDAHVVTIMLIALGWLPGLLNGLLIVRARLQPFIVTLGMWFILDGLALVVLPTAGGTVNGALAWIGGGQLLGLDSSVWIMVGAGVLVGWLLRTRVGLQIRAVGSDREAAHQSGIPVGPTLILTYCISSEFAVLAGIVLSFQSLSGDPTSGDTYILGSVAAAVIGGTSLAGGRGSAIGTIVGTLILSYLLSVVFALGFASEWSLICEGGLLVISLVLQTLVRRFFGHERRI